MKKSISSGVTGWTKKLGEIFRPDGKQRRPRLEISEPHRQVGGTSVDHVESLLQLTDHLVEIEKSAKYMKKLIEKDQKELIPQVVTLIIEVVQKMLDDIVIVTGRQREVVQWNSFFESRQQEARNYLAALVKLSDSSTEISHDDTQMTQEMVSKLEKVLRNIIDYARFKFPVTSLPPLPPGIGCRQSLHSSIENLEYDECDRHNNGSFGRSHIRRSFRSLSKKTKELIYPSSIRPPSIERTVKRRSMTGRSRSVVGRHRSNQSNVSEGITFLSLNSADLQLESDRSNIDVRYQSSENSSFNQANTSSPHIGSSRPCSSASFGDILSTSGSSTRYCFGSEDIVVDGPPLPQKYCVPPLLPPKKVRPLGGLNVFTPQKHRLSMVSSDSRDSYLNYKSTDNDTESSLTPPEIPEKKSSPMKNQRDSGYNELNDANSMLGTPEQMVDRVLADKVKSDFIEAFLSSFRTFLKLEKLIDELLRRIRVADSCQSLTGIPVQILIRVVEQMVYTELTDDILEQLNEEICWMMTHREKNFLTYAKQLRESVQRIVSKRKTSQRPTSMGHVIIDDMGLLGKLKKDGTLFLDYSSEIFSRHLCILDADFYRSIEPSEFVLAAMSDTQDPETTPNFAAAVYHFNSVSYWTQGLILSQNNPGKETADIRERILLNFFKILSHLRKLNNFNSYFAVVAGVSSKAVTRLHWKSSIQEKIQEFQKITSVDKNFCNYRPLLKESELPCVPYIGIVRQDLYQVHLREKPMKDGMVNFDRVMRIHNLLDQNRRFRESKYDFQKSSDIDRRFGGFLSLQNDDMLWDMSYRIRPILADS